MEFWLVAFTGVTTLAVALQAGILTALFLGVRKTQAKIDLLLDRDLPPLLNNARDLVADARKTVDKVNGTVDQIAGFAQTQAERLDVVLGEASDRARMQVIRLDQLIGDAMNRLERTTEQVHDAVSGPIREISAVLIGLRAGLDALLGRRRSRDPRERTTHDEEMFI